MTIDNETTEPFNALAHLESAWAKFLDDPEPPSKPRP